MLIYQKLCHLSMSILGNFRFFVLIFNLVFLLKWANCNFPYNAFFYWAYSIRPYTQSLHLFFYTIEISLFIFSYHFQPKIDLSSRSYCRLKLKVYPTSRLRFRFGAKVCPTSRLGFRFEPKSCFNARSGFRSFPKGCFNTRSGFRLIFKLCFLLCWANPTALRSL